jgi:hypothetical protein
VLVVAIRVVNSVDNKFYIKCSTCDSQLAYTRKYYAIQRQNEKAKCKSCKTQPKEKECILCKITKPIDMFPYRTGKQKHLFDSRCKECKYTENTAWRQENKEKVLEYRAKDTWNLKKRCSRYAITEKQFLDMFNTQNSCCKICDSTITIDNSAIDHNHATGDIRGILCKTCNRALGMFKDSPKILEKALDYLMIEGYYGEE